MKHWYKLLWVIVAVILLWYFTGAILRFFPGLVYTVDGPVHVVAVHDDRVQLEMQRTARVTMAAQCARYITCENTVTLKTDDCPVYQTGFTVTRKEFPLPPSAFNGSDQVECFYAGLITLYPMGGWGPGIYVPWKSEPFIANKPTGG